MPAQVVAISVRFVLGPRLWLSDQVSWAVCTMVQVVVAIVADKRAMQHTNCRFNLARKGRNAEYFETESTQLAPIWRDPTTSTLL